jgi:hypothetical protein
VVSVGGADERITVKRSHTKVVTNSTIGIGALLVKSITQAPLGFKSTTLEVEIALTW